MAQKINMHVNIHTDAFRDKWRDRAREKIKQCAIHTRATLISYDDNDDDDHKVLRENGKLGK